MKQQTPFLHPEHCDTQAVQIVHKLQKQGFTAYFVGGCVRDLLLGIEPKDFDIATNARPQQIKRCIPYAYIIGRRFRLVLVRREEQQFEVSTFRRTLPSHEQTNYKGMVLDNAFGQPDQDAKRRDFTINGLFYDPIAHKVIDYVGGEKDLARGIVRTIGPAAGRVQEDPVRILRAIRLAHKINFAIDTDLKLAVQKHAATLATSLMPRRREEVLKFLRLKEPRLAFLRALDLGVLPYLSPALGALCLDEARWNQFLYDLDNLSHKHLQDSHELLGILMLAYFKNVLSVQDLSAIPKINNIEQMTTQNSNTTTSPSLEQTSVKVSSSSSKTSSKASSKTKNKFKKPKPPFYLPKGMKEPSYTARVNVDYKNIKLYLQHLSSVNFMRHELGMSNLEQRMVWKYFHLYPQLFSTQHSSAKIEQLLRNEAFLFSLSMGTYELHLSSQHQAYWYNKWQQYAAKTQATNEK